MRLVPAVGILCWLQEAFRFSLTSTTPILITALVKGLTYSVITKKGPR